MAQRGYEDDDRRGAPWWVLLFILMLLLAAIFFAWRWFSDGASRRAAAPAPIEEISATPPAIDVPDVIEPTEPPLEELDEIYVDDFEEPPAIEDPPPPAPENFTHVVYFELMEWTLTPQAETSLAAELSAFEPWQVSRVEIDGFTDTAGTANYNQPLSVRRAQIIRRFLIERGIGRERITMRGHGETRLAEPTADGVREPLNRRAVISFAFD